jgi:hypothetical protein
MVCPLIYNRDLACGEDARLDYYNVISTTGEHGMSIITLGRLYFMLSCRLTPTDAASRETCSSEAISSLIGSHLLQKWARKLFGPDSLVGF